MALLLAANFFLLIVVVGFAMTTAAASANGIPPSPLSPLRWPSGFLSDFMQLTKYFGPHPEAVMTLPPLATNGGAVSGSSNILAVFSGMFALLNGGNAMDACLTTAIVETVLAANSYVSLAGIVDIVYFDALTNKSTSIYGGWGRPSEASRDLLQNVSAPIGASVLVPGFLRGVEYASSTFGKLPFARLFDAAIFFAAEGSPNEPLRGLNTTMLRQSPEGMALLQQIENTSLTNFTQPELAELLQSIQSAGNASTMYDGAFAADMIQAVTSHGGLLSMDELRRYQPHVADATRVNVATPQSAGTTALHLATMNVSIGAVEVAEEVGILEYAGVYNASYDWDRGASSTSSVEVPPSPMAGNATAVAWIAETLRWSSAMTNMFLGGAATIQYAVYEFPDIFSTPGACSNLATLSSNVPYAFMQCRMLRQVHLNVWTAMSSNVTTFNARLSTFLEKVAAMKPTQPQRSDVRHVRETTHSDAVTATDSLGNTCSVAHSINTATMWGTGIFVRGVPLSDAAFGALNKEFIFAESAYPPHHLLTPTRPLLGVNVASISKRSQAFGLSTIGSSLQQVTLLTLSAILAGAPSLTQTVNNGQLLYNMNPSGAPPLSLSINTCATCATTDYLCNLENAQTNCMASAFVESLPQWITPFLVSVEGAARFGSSGPMAVARRISFDNGSVVFEATATPALNGGGLIGAS